MMHATAIEERVSYSNQFELGPAFDRASDLASDTSGRVPDDNSVRMSAIALNHGLLIAPARIRDIAPERPTREMRLNFLRWEVED